MKTFNPDATHVGPQGGFISLKLMIIIFLVGFSLMLMARVGPGYYDYYVLRDLADRVVEEYATLPPSEVERRVSFELGRSRIQREEDTINFKQTKRGYKVVVNYHIPLDFEFAGRPFKLEGYEEWLLTYEAGE